MRCYSCCQQPIHAVLMLPTAGTSGNHAPDSRHSRAPSSTRAKLPIACHHAQGACMRQFQPCPEMPLLAHLKLVNSAPAMSTAAHVLTPRPCGRCYPMRPSNGMAALQRSGCEHVPHASQACPSSAARAAPLQASPHRQLTAGEAACAVA
jgi:hypothetical protein